MSKYINTFAKDYTSNWFEEVFVIKEVKNTEPWAYIFSDVNGEKIVGTYYKNKLEKTNREDFRIEKVIKSKGDKSYVSWKGYDNSFNSYRDEKDIV